MDQNERKKVGIPTLKRLPLYLRLLRQMKEDGRDYASGTVVAKKLSLDPIVVRKDLAITGAVGRPRLGFPMDEIIEAIEDFLGWTNTSEAFLVGVGNLGRALLRHKGFEQHGLKIISGFDSNPTIVGDVIAGKKIYDINDLKSRAKSRHIQIGILTVSPPYAQDIADIIGISYDTVRFHTKNLYKKLDVNERVFAVVKSLRLGLVTPTYVKI